MRLIVGCTLTATGFVFCQCLWFLLFTARGFYFCHCTIAGLYKLKVGYPFKWRFFMVQLWRRILGGIFFCQCALVFKIFKVTSVVGCWLYLYS